MFQIEISHRLFFPIMSWICALLHCASGMLHGLAVQCVLGFICVFGGIFQVFVIHCESIVS